MSSSSSLAAKAVSALRKPSKVLSPASPAESPIHIVARMPSATACLKSVVSACSSSVPVRSSMLTSARAAISS